MPETAIMILGPGSAQRDCMELSARRHAGNVIVCEDCAEARDGLRTNKVRSILVIAGTDDEHLDEFLTQVRKSRPHLPVFFVETNGSDILTGRLLRYGLVMLPSNLPAPQVEQILFPVPAEAAAPGSREGNGQVLVIGRTQYPFHFAHARALFEAQLITTVLRRERGNVSKAARSIGMARRNLQLKIAAHNIDVTRIRQEP